MKAHLLTSFINVDESSALCDEVEMTRQSVYEPGASIRDVSKKSLTTPTRWTLGTKNRTEFLIRAFARELRSDELAQKLVQKGNPTTLEEAFTILSGYSARKDAYARLSRHEEPMDVAPVTPGPSRPVVIQDYKAVLLLKKLLQSQERQSTPQGAVHEPGASWTPDENLSVLGAVVSATCAESAAKAARE